MFVLGLQDEPVELLLVLIAGIVLECILGDYLATEVVIAEIRPEVIVQLCALEFFVRQFVVQFAHLLIGLLGVRTLGIEFDELGKGLNSLTRHLLVETCVRRVQVLTMAYLEIRLGGIFTLWVIADVCLVIIGGRLVQFLPHVTAREVSQHILRSLGAFVIGGHIVEQRLRLDILLLVEILQGGLVLLLRVPRFQQFLVLPTTREKHQRQQYV